VSLLRDVVAVGRYEVAEATRTRLFQLVIAGYLLGIGFADWALVQVLKEMEGALATQMGLPATERPGAMINTLRENGNLLELLRPLTGSEAAARALLDTPPLALWAGAAAMFLLPAVVVAATAGSVAAEVRSRSIRYLLVRTGRLSIGLGKLVGQLFVIALATLAGAVLSWAMGMVLTVGNAPLELATALLFRSACGILYALPYVGIGMGASMVVASPNGARLLAGLALVLSPSANWWLTKHSGTDFAGRLADLGTLLWPNHLWGAYWSGDPAEVAGAVLHGCILGTLWFALGFAVFQRRNL
jgi:ABC-type transport system involved in multi-copper enzyme maturation permease subunit